MTSDTPEDCRNRPGLAPAMRVATFQWRPCRFLRSHPLGGQDYREPVNLCQEWVAQSCRDRQSYTPTSTQASL